MEYGDAIKRIMQKRGAEKKMDIERDSFRRIVYILPEASMTFIEYTTLGQDGFPTIKREITVSPTRGNDAQAQDLEERLKRELEHMVMTEIMHRQYQPHSLTG